MISPVGTLAASWRRTEPQLGIRLFDLKLGKELGMLGGKYDSYPMVFSPDGKTLYADSYDENEMKAHPGQLPGYIRSWDVATRKVTRIVARHDDHVHRLVLSSDGSSLAFMSPSPPSRGSDSNIIIHDTTTGAKVCQIPAFSLTGSFAFSPDGQKLAVATDGKSPREGSCVEVWDIAKEKKLRQLAPGPFRYGLLMAFSPDGKTLVTSGFDRLNDKEHRIRLWEFATGGERFQLSGHTGVIESLAFAEHGRKLISASHDTTALVWDITGSWADEGKVKTTDPGAAWKTLATADAAKGYAAIWALIRTPARSVAFLREHLRPIQPVDAKVIAKLVLDLDSPTFAVRQEASAALAKLEGVAEADLRKMLGGQPSLELRRRVEQLLEELESLPAAQLQKLRAVEALERIGTPEAEELLRTLATGAAAARLTREASASLQRLSRSDAVMPK